ncbi:PH domain-containing protein [Phenylobacterium sp.]|jgi:uncharacterized membrane protein YdbT with pleckstrin-like domain|uniref:PH domain-containing protein n=1 Tax=Phenylobacterium sp. TaxID=1871053 RepID=UPI002F91F7C4
MLKSYVDEVLAPGETVAARAEFHWTCYVAPVFWTLATLGFGIVLTGPWMIAIWLGQKSTDLVATDRRLIHKTGLIGRTVVEHRLEKIETINVEQSVLGRMLNYGTVSVTGTGVSTISFPRIADPLGFKRGIEAAAHKVQFGASRAA